MAREVTSKHLGNASELTVMMPIKPGFVDASATVSYATRARVLLETLNGIRKVAREKNELNVLAGPIERLRTIHFARFSIFDNDTRLLMAVSFDRAWEPYIRKIARDAGPVLDAILCNCSGYEEYATDNADGYAKFAHWVRKNQVRCEFFYAPTSGLSADDLRYLSELEELQRKQADPRKRDREIAEMRLPEPGVPSGGLTREQVAGAQIEQGLKVLKLLHRLRGLYPDPPPDIKTRDHLYLRRLAQSVLAGFDSQGLLADGHPLREKLKRELDWLETKQASPTKTRETPPPQDQVQGDILTGYPGMSHSALLLMQLPPKQTRQFVACLASEVTTEGKVANLADDEVTLNAAFTWDGLRNLGLTDAQLAAFPKEFREGMAARAGLLGDVRCNHPDNWNLPALNRESADSPQATVRLSSVDVVVQLQARKDKKKLDEKIAELRKQGARILSIQELHRQRRGGHVTEHFGFRDGISQPDYRTEGRDKVALGELLLGYANDRGDPKPEDNPLLNNGTFLVVRKLEQHVSRLDQRLEEFLAKKRNQKFRADFESDDSAKNELKARLMGRTVDGRALVDRDRDPGNDFDYSQDPKGRGCPFQAHIRRANPRFSDAAGNPRTVPRIVRRGYSYGKEGEGGRGLLFMAYNASIGEQFEVIQRWISGGNSSGVMSRQDDPFLGVPLAGRNRIVRFTRKRKVFRLDLGHEPLVSLKWGLYLFVPSKAALSLLVKARPARAAECERGREAIEKLKALERYQAAHPPADPNDRVALKWKALLEDPSARASGMSAQVWAAIRQHYDGVLPTPYGVLVGREDQVMEIFRDPDSTYSVREYWERMRRSIGEIYLGMDPDPQPMDSGADQDALKLDKLYRKAVPKCRYQRESKITNPMIGGVHEHDAFELAREHTEVWLKRQRPDPRGDTIIDLRDFGDEILAELSFQWFGLPDGKFMKKGGRPASVEDPDIYCPHYFLAPSRYIFPPNPTGFGARLAQNHGAELLEKAKKFVAAVRADPSVDKGTLSNKMFAAMTDDDEIARTLVGLMHGFLPTTFGNFLSVMNQWLDDERLWRLQLELLRNSGSGYDRANGVLRESLTATMQRGPVPELLHRTAIKAASINGLQVNPGERIVLGIVSATQQQLDGSHIKMETLFGGDYRNPPDPGATRHACPGQRMAIGVLLGMISALLDAGTLSPAGPRLVVTLRG